MKLTELIGRLAEMLEDYGDVHVEVRNPAGDMDHVGTVAVENVGLHQVGVTYVVIEP